MTHVTIPSRELCIRSIKLQSDEEARQQAHLIGPGGTIGEQWERRSQTPMIGFYYWWEPCVKTIVLPDKNEVSYDEEHPILLILSTSF